jgi:hypothetical protein
MAFLLSCAARATGQPNNNTHDKNESVYSAVYTNINPFSGHEKYYSIGHDRTKTTVRTTIKNNNINIRLQKRSLEGQVIYGGQVSYEER